MEQFDMLLFENYRLAKNHKIDVLLIAHLLQHAGMKVAILDIYHDDAADDIEGIPVVHHHIPVPATLADNRPQNPLKRILYRGNYFRQQYDYMAAVRDEVKGFAKRFYCGSYHLGMSSAWFELKKPCYWWGLRSNRFQLSKKHYQEDKLTFVRIPYLKRIFMRNPYQCLFVSNELIKEEFLRLGLPESRMVVREERVIEQLGDVGYHRLSRYFSFLTIGQLRPQKRVEQSIASFLALADATAKYMIVGSCSKDYEQVLNNAIGNSKKIERVSGFLDYTKFLDYFKQSHFVVFADEPIKGTVTNGTMLEALINYRPIIAPNYNPYRYYIEKYHVGIMYNPTVEGDLTLAMREAMRFGTNYFERAIDIFLSTILFDTVSEKLYNQITLDKP